MNELSQRTHLKNLPFLATLQEASKISWRSRAVLLRWIMGGTLITGAFCYLQEYLIEYVWTNKDWTSFGRIAILILFAFPTVMFSAMFSVFCHRLVLTNGERESSGWLTFGKREWRYLGWNLTLCLAGILIGFLVIIFNYFATEVLEEFKEAFGNPVFSKISLGHYFFTIFFLG